MKRSFIFFLAAAASFVVTSLVVWFVLDADPLFRKADATTSTAVPSKAVAPEPFKTAHAANQTTTRILALDQAKQLAFWTFVLKGKSRLVMLLSGPCIKAALNPGSITGAFAVRTVTNIR
jgi:hypothetical protein